MSKASIEPPREIRREVETWLRRDIPHMCKGVAPPVVTSLRLRVE